jgi:hypothetical protein
MSELDRELEALRREEVGDSFPAVSAWLHRVESERARATSSAHRRRLVLVFPSVRMATALGALLLLAVACALPVRQTDTVGMYASARFPGTAEQARAAVARLPWARGALSLTSTGADGRSTLYLVPVGRDPAVARRWAYYLSELPGAMDARVAPLQDQVVRPGYAAAGRALFGARFPGAEMSERERMGRVIALASELAPGSVVVMDHPRAGIPGEAVVYPRSADSAGRVEVAVADDPQVSLMVLRRREGAEPDTVLVPLDAGKLQGASDAERTEVVRRALRERGIDNVDVRVEDGIVRVTAVPDPKP